MKRLLTFVALFALLATSLVSTATAAQGPEREYLVIARGNSLPANLNRAMRDSGGAVVRKIPEIGVAVVSSTDANFKSRASRASGVQSVVPNIKVSWLDPVENVAVNPAEVGNPPNSGSADFFFDLQWGHDAVDAPAPGQPALWATAYGWRCWMTASIPTTPTLRRT
ncbi:hypothetical protein BH23CHL1_BH23CHL1_15430 [soil metagenome]